MKALAKRIAALEMGDMNEYAHWTDEQIHARLVEITGELQLAGLDLPDNWREQMDADPVGFIKLIEPQCKAMEERWAVL